MSTPMAAPSMASGTTGATSRLASGEIEREPSEVEQDERQRRELCGQRNAQRLAEPAGRTVAREARHGSLGRTAQCQQAGRGRQRQLQTDIVDHARLRQQQAPAGQAQGGSGPRGPAALASDEHDAAHQRRTDDAGFSAGEDGVGHDGGDDDGAARPPAQARRTQQCRGDAGHQGDVPAADGDHVREPGDGEVVGHLPAHAFAQADEDARGKPGLGLGDGSRQSSIDTPAQLLDRSAEAGAARDQLEPARLERTPCAAGFEEAGEPRGIGWRTLERAVHGDGIAGHQRRMARQPGVDEPSGIGTGLSLEVDEGALFGARGRGHVDDHPAPLAAALRQRRRGQRRSGHEGRERGAQSDRAQGEQQGRARCSLAAARARPRQRAASPRPPAPAGPVPAARSGHPRRAAPRTRRRRPASRRAAIGTPVSSVC